MKKIIILLLLFAVKGYSQNRNIPVSGFDTTTGRPGYKYTLKPIYVQSPVTLPNDSTIGADTSVLATQYYVNTHVGGDSAIWKNSATYTAGNKVLTMGTSSQQFSGSRVLFDSIRIGYARLYQNAQGLNIGFSDSTTTNTANSNIDITPLTDVSNKQTFDVMSGAGNVKIMASSAGKPKANTASGQTISGSNNTLLNYGGQTSTISGDNNVVIGNTTWAGTSGSVNIGLGTNALNGITTGSGNIHLSTYNGIWGYGNISNTVIFGDISNQGEAFSSNDVAFCPAGAFSSGNYWLNGRKMGNGSLYSPTLNTAASSGTNIVGNNFSIRGSRGTGTAEPGIIDFQFSTPVASGTTTHSVFTETMKLERLGVTLGRASSLTRDGTALVDMQSTQGGVLFPRMTTAERDSLKGIATIAINSAGSGQTAGTYSVVFSGGGNGVGATATAIVNGSGVATSVTLLTNGNLYTGTVTGTIVSGGTPATFTTTLAIPKGLIVFLTDSNSLFQYNGTDWQNLYNISSGTVTTTGTQTLTNKRWVARVDSTTSSATPTINTDNVDIYKITAQSADITSFTTNLSGTPNDGDILEIQITGTAARAITWGTSFVASTVALPTTTVTTTTLTTIFQYYKTTSYGNVKWICVNSF